MEYNGGLEKAILRDSELLSEVNDAFCKSHPLLAQKVVTRSARAAVSKIGADALVGDEVHPPTPLPFTQPPLLDTLLPPYCPPPAAAAALPLPSRAAPTAAPPPTAELPPPLPHRQQQSCPHLQQQKQEHRRYLHQPHHRHQYWHQCPHHHFACCHPGRCHHHPHGFHGQNQAATAIEEAGGDKEDKAEPYRTLRTHIHIISIIKFFNLPPFKN